MNPVKPVIALSFAAAAAVLVQGCASVVETSLNDQRFGAVRIGMTSDEVRGALGSPLKTERFPLSNKLAWDYMGTDTWGYMVDYSVTFGADQRVESKFARRINDGGDHGGH